MSYSRGRGGRPERGGRGGRGGAVSLEDLSQRKRPRAGVLVNPLTRQVYQMIIRQLHHDGYLGAAAALSDASGICAPNVNENGDELMRLVAGGLATESMRVKDVKNFFAEQVVERYVSAHKLYVPLHLSQSWSVGRKCFKMKERFVTASLGGVIRAISFSADGSLVSCCGTNGLAAVFSLETMEDLCAVDQARAANRMRGGNTAGHGDQDSAGATSAGSATFNNANEITELSLARRFHEHTQSVEVARFHPTQPALLTGGVDGDLYLRDYSHPNPTVQLKVHDNFPIRSAAYHPTGEYVLFGTDHHTPRLVNVRTGKILTTPLSSGSGAGSERILHTAGLTGVDFSKDGRTFVTASLDGAWIIYDGVSGKAIHQIENAHGSVPVTSAVFSRSGQFLLSAGMDSTARLWDLRYLGGPSGGGSSSPVQNSSHAAEVMSFGEPGKCDYRNIRAVFSSDESHVVCQDTTLCAIHAHCVYTGEVSYTLTTQPPSTQRGLAHSPFSNLIISGGDDCRMRLWTPSWLPS